MFSLSHSISSIEHDSMACVCGEKFEYDEYGSAAVAKQAALRHVGQVINEPCPVVPWCIGHHGLLPGERVEDEVHSSRDIDLIEFTAAAAGSESNEAIMNRSVGPDMPDGYDLLIHLDGHVTLAEMDTVADELERLAVQLRTFEGAA